MTYDITIVGAGVVGAMIARALSKYRLSVCMAEKENDVACGASKANSGIIHGGYDPIPGTLKASLNSVGVPLLYAAAKELNVPFVNNGSMVLAFNAEEDKILRELKERGKINKTDKLQLLYGSQARLLEPNISPAVTSALLVPSSGIISPYELTIAAAGNAMDNGVDLMLNYEVCSISRDDGIFTVTDAGGREIRTKYLINCAGCFAGSISLLAGDDPIDIIPRAGEYMLLDKTVGTTVSRTVFQAPTSEGKGVLVTPTADGNLLIGPTARRVGSLDDTDTTSDGLATVVSLAKRSVPGIDPSGVITSFTGVRASHKDGDFIIKNSEKIPHLIHVAAIDSPGLTSCVAIANTVLDLLRRDNLKLTEKEQWNGTRPDTHAFRKLSEDEQAEYIKTHPAYGRIVCRCEMISEGEMIDAILRDPPARDLDAVKRRTRSGMGRCQGGFCSPRVMRLISEYGNIPLCDVTKKGGASNMTYGRLDTPAKED